MVAVVTGNGLGVNTSSLRTLGDAGVLGSSGSGRGGEQVIVNAATGNLVLRRSDDFLLTLGADFGLVNTYNSQGVLTYDNTDTWQLSAHKRVRNLTGTVNTAGSTVTRADGDGSEQLYTYDTGRAMYVSNDGEGAYDTLSYSTGTLKWTWTAADSGASEIYSATGTNNGRLEESRNPDGNVLTYLYDASNRLAEIRSNAVTGDSLFIDYAASTNNVSQVRAVVKQPDGSTATVTRVRYTYDGSNRLATIQTDLSPTDNSIANGAVYTTTFTYNANGLVATISETDGSSLAFTYVSVGSPAAWRVATITDALSRVTQFSYNTSTLTTTVTDGMGNQSLLTYDSSNRLITIKAPIVGGVTPTTSFAYNATGDVTSVTDARNNTTIFQYDTRGNLTLKRDAFGNTITRIYDTTGTRNLLLSETLYAVPDPDGAGAATASAPLVTRYAYDTNLHLRFVVSAEGVVQENRYDAYGNRTSSLRYPTTKYDVSALAATATLTEAQLTSWLTTAVKSDAQRVDYLYDLRGQLKKSTAYATVDSTGVGIIDGKESVTQYVYDYFGSLLQRIDPNGNTTAFTYDGLGRALTSVTTPSGGGATVTTTYSYDDAGNRTLTTFANGLITTNLYNKDGELLSVTQTGPGSVAMGTTSYAYDADGQLRMQTSPTGQRQYFDFDADGRMVASVDADGSFTDYIYNRDNQLIKSVLYSTRVAAGPLATLVDAGGNRTAVTLASVRPVATATDRLMRYVYDSAGQRVYTLTSATLNQTNDNTKYAVVKTVYDGAGRVASTVAYTNLYTVAGTVDEVLTTDITSVTLVPDAVNDRATRNLYDNAGRQAGTLDAQGYLVEYVYDNADQLTKTVAYANVTNSAYWSTGTLANLRPTTNANDVTTYRFFDGQGRQIGELDAAGYLSERTYDRNGNVATDVRYSAVLTYVPGTSTFASLKATASASPNHTTSYAYDAFNRVTQQTTFEGVITQNTYDSVGNLTQSVRAFGTSEARTLQRRYDALGRVVAELTPRGVAQLNGGMTQPQIDAIWNQYGVRYVYDLSGNLVKKITPDGSGTTGLTTWFYYDADSRLTDTVNAMGEVERLAYDAFGRVTSRTCYATRLASTAGLTGGYGSVSVTASPSTDTVTQYTYYISGRLATELTQEGGLITHQYNAFGQESVRFTKVDATRTLRQELDYNTRGLLTQTRDDPSGILVSQTRNYDAFGRVVGFVDGRGNTSTTSYDRLGRAIQLTNPLTQSRWVTYDAYSRVLTTADGVSANATTYAYNDATRSVVVTTPEGVALTTLHNRYGQTATVTEANGNVTSYTYDLDGNLATVSDSIGTQTTNTYDLASRLSTTTDANGITTTIAYDSVNRVFTRKVDSAAGGLGLLTTYGYDGQGRQITVTAPDGTVTQTNYDRDGRVVAIIVDPAGFALKTTFAYDFANHTITMTEGAGTPVGGDTTAAKVTTYQYDILGRRTSVAETDSGTTTYVYDKNDNVVARTDPRNASYVTRYVYDGANRLIYAVDPLGGVTENTYDASGRVAATKRYANAISLAGLPNEITAADVTGRRTLDAARDRLRQFVYDRDGREVYTVDNLSSSLAVVAKKVYDTAGNLVRTISYATPIAAGTYTSVSQMDPLVPAVPTASDREVRYVFDARHRTVYTVDGLGAVTRSQYDGVGNVVQQSSYAALYSPGTVPTLADMTTWVTANANVANDRVTLYWYDAIGRQVYALNAERYIVKNVYNDASRTVTETRYALSIPTGTSLTTSSTLAQVAAAITTSGADQSTTTQRDRGGRTTQVTDALGQIETYAYDRVGNKLSYTNQKGSIWTYTYDANHRLLTEVSPQVNVATVTGLDTDTSLTFTNVGMVAITTRMTYDALGNVLTRTEAYGRPEARTTSYQYDALGRQVAITLPAVTVYSPAGDSVTRVGTAVVRTESAYTPISTVTYDALGNAVVNQNIAGNYSYRIYDQLGRVRYEIDAEKYVSEHQYDRFGNETATVRYANRYAGALTGVPLKLSDVTGVTLPPDAANDRTITKTYDRLNRLATVQLPSVFVFDPNTSTAGGVTYSAGAKTVYTYNGFGQVISSAQRATGTTTETYATTYFIYDRLGRQVATVDPLGYATSFSYDATNNLTRQTEFAASLPTNWQKPTGTNPGSIGSPTTTTPAGQPGDPAGNGYDRDVGYTYDRLNRVTLETRYNVEYSTVSGQVTTRTYSNVTTSYGYDAVGNRTSTTDVNGAVTYTYYDALGRIRAVADVGRNRGDSTTIVPLTEFLRNARGDLVQTIKYSASATGVSAAGYTVAATANIDEKVSLLLDAQGRVLRSEDPTGADRFVSYTARGDVAKEWQRVSNPGDTVTTYDALVTIHEYDKLGRETAVVEPQTLPRDGSDPTPTVVVRSETTYNAFGEQTSKLVRENSQTGVAAQVVNWYDQAGRLWRSNADGIYRVYLYNQLGKVTAEVHSKELNLSAYTDAASVAALATQRIRTETVYDLDGRIVTQRLPSFMRTDPTEALNTTVGLGTMSKGSNPDAGYVDLTAIGGGILWAPGTGGCLRDGTPSAYTVTSARYLYWADPANVVGESATNGQVFEYRPTGTTPWLTLTVDKIFRSSDSARFLGVNVAGLTGTYDWRIRYSRDGGTTSFAIRSGTMTNPANTAGTVSDTTNSSLGGTAIIAPVVSQQLDRWGDVIAYTDAIGNTTNYRYNQYGQMIEKKLPTVQIKTVSASSGAITVSNGRPVQENHYDRLGRLIATKDGNGYVNSLTLNAAGQAIAETHADQTAGQSHGTSPILKGYVYDSFGNKVWETDERGFATQFGYDRANQLTSTKRESVLGAIIAGITANYVGESFVYDEAGRRVADVNGMGETTRYWYDLRDQMRKRATPRGYATTMVYDLYGNKSQETDAIGGSKAWTYDYFGRLLAKDDLGFWTSAFPADIYTPGTHHTYTYTGYAGLLATLTSSLGQSITYTYDEAGQLTGINDVGTAVSGSGLRNTNQQTSITYDAAGRHAKERTTVDGVLHQSEWITYDAAGRLASTWDIGGGVQYSYDGQSNRTQVLSTAIAANNTLGGVNSLGWYGTLASLDSVQIDAWYKYDEMNRVLISQGWNIANAVVADNATNTPIAANRRSIALVYDAAGNRTSVTNYGTKYNFSGSYSTSNDYSQESYSYDGMNRLTSVLKDSLVTTGSYVYDKASRQTQATNRTIESSSLVTRVQTNVYTADGLAASQTTTKNGNTESIVTFGDSYRFSGFDEFFNFYSGLTQGYDAAGNLNSYTLKVYSSGNYQYTSTYSNTYRTGDGYLQATQSVQSTSGGPAANTTTKTYDVDLNVVKFTDTKDATLTRGFAYNAAGEVLTDVKGNFANDAAIATALTNTVAATNTGNWGRYFFENGENVGRAGALTNDAAVLKSNFDVNYSKVTGTSVQAPSQIAAVAGDTLRIIAQRIWGDASLWFVLADENGLSDPDAEIVEGTLLTVPNQILAVSNNASTFKPFDLTAAIGDTTPIAKFPPPKKHGCGVIGMIIVIIVLIIVTIYTAGAAAGALASSFSTATAAGAGTVATGMAGGAAVFSGASGLTAGLAVTAGAVGGALGSAASQVVGMGLGVQDSFSWKQVALSAIGSGVAAGMATAGAASTLAKALGTSNRYALSGANAAVSNALTQGVGVVTGLQDSFDWRSVAASAIAAPLGRAAMDHVVGPMLGADPNSFVQKFGSTLTGGLTSAAVQSALGGKVNMVSVLTDAFANAVGNSLVDAMSAPTLQEIEITAKRMPEPGAAANATGLDQNPGVSFDPPGDVRRQLAASAQRSLGSAIASQAAFPLNAVQPNGLGLADPIENVTVTARKIYEGQDAGLDMWWWTQQYRGMLSEKGQGLVDRMAVDAGANYNWRQQYGHNAGWLTDRVGGAFDALTGAQGGTGGAMLDAAYGTGSDSVFAARDASALADRTAIVEFTDSLRDGSVGGDLLANTLQTFGLGGNTIGRDLNAALSFVSDAGYRSRVLGSIGYAMVHPGEVYDAARLAMSDSYGLSATDQAAAFGEFGFHTAGGMAGGEVGGGLLRVGRSLVTPIDQTVADLSAGGATRSGSLIGNSGYSSIDEFTDAVTAQYQMLYDQGYAQATRNASEGLITNSSRAIGSDADSFARVGLRDWLRNIEGIQEGPEQIIQVNRRLYDPNGSGAFRVPDVYIPGSRTILDGSISFKTGASRQIIDFGTFSGGARTTIVVPSGLPWGSYSIVH